MPREFGNVQLYAEHLPDVDVTGGESTELPGFVEVGVYVDGAKVPLARVKAGDVLEQIDAATKARRSSEHAGGGNEPPPDQGF